MSRTPIEKAVREFEVEWDSTVESWDPEKTAATEFITGCMRKGLTAALDRDELDSVLKAHRNVGWNATMCACGWPGIGTATTPDEHRGHQAAALISHLLGGAS